MKQAGKTWFEHLTNGLEKCGFKQSKVDQCILYKRGLAIICYVDDCLIFAEKVADADNLIKQELRQEFIFTDEGTLVGTSEDVNSYLGIQIKLHSDEPWRLSSHLKQSMVGHSIVTTGCPSGHELCSWHDCNCN